MLTRGLQNKLKKRLYMPDVVINDNLQYILESIALIEDGFLE